MTLIIIAILFLSALVLLILLIKHNGNLKEKVEITQAVITIAAIFVGGIWTYRLFIKERKHYPHAIIEQKASHIALSKDINLLRVNIALANKGYSMLVSKKSIIRIQQILPVLPCIDPKRCAVNEVNDALKEIERKEDRFSWPLISERNKIYKKTLEIEPGEKEIIDFEFAIPSKVKAVRIYGFFRNEEKSEDEVGWSISSYYNFEKTHLEK